MEELKSLGELFERFGAVFLFMLYFAYRDHVQRGEDKKEKMADKLKYDKMAADHIKIIANYEKVTISVAQVLDDLVEKCQRIGDSIKDTYPQQSLQFPNKHRYRTPHPHDEESSEAIHRLNLKDIANKQTTEVHRNKG